MGRFSAWCAGILSGAVVSVASMATAETRPVVVELFTSQGCSSCPPADAFLHELSQREEVIALALHVDYWDYIGWKDSFAQPAFTARQKAYAKSGGRRSVYTPQMIISGQEHVVGTHQDDANTLIRRHATQDTGIDILAERNSAGLVTISAQADAGVTGPLSIYLVGYSPRQTVEITRGENAGRTVDYVNVVTDWVKIGDWDLASPLKIQTQSDGRNPAVVILQRHGPGAIMAAAHLR